jgi:hypothetical protein
MWINLTCSWCVANFGFCSDWVSVVRAMLPTWTVRARSRWSSGQRHAPMKSFCRSPHCTLSAHTWRGRHTLHTRAARGHQYRRPGVKRLSLHRRQTRLPNKGNTGLWLPTQQGPLSEHLPRLREGKKAPRPKLCSALSSGRTSTTATWWTRKGGPSPPARAACSTWRGTMLTSSNPRA